MSPQKWILPIIVISQFLCTSLWFAGNGVMADLVINFKLEESAVGHLTSAVQFGFILGTLVFAFLSIADRFSPSKVFFISALLGALFNLGTVLESNSLWSLLAFRFLTGFFLAGIYPVGMKIAADYYEKGLGKSLGYLVGALVLGTAFPHFLKYNEGLLAWKAALMTTSILAALGGLLMVILVPDGPYRKTSQKLDLSSVFKVFQHKDFRAAAFGYFGHMWELYAFWAFVPVMLTTYQKIYPETSFNIPVWCFLIISIGSLGCICAGYLSQKWGAKRIATTALFLSGLCCLFSPFLLSIQYTSLLIVFLLFWGLVVIADSPLFSTLVAQNAIAELKGTALTIVNCIGFAITIVSIQLINILYTMTEANYIYVVLGLGPVFGLLALRERTKPS